MPVIRQINIADSTFAIGAFPKDIAESLTSQKTIVSHDIPEVITRPTTSEAGLQDTERPDGRKNFPPGKSLLRVELSRMLWNESKAVSHNIDSPSESHSDKK